VSRRPRDVAHATISRLSKVEIDIYSGGRCTNFMRMKAALENVSDGPKHVKQLAGLGYPEFAKQGLGIVRVCACAVCAHSQRARPLDLRG